MKNFRYSILAFIIFNVVSCSGEDDSPKLETSNLVGEWFREDMNYTGTSTVNFGETSMTTLFSGELLESDAIIFLKENNTWTSGGNYTIRLTSDIEGMTDVQEVSVTDLSGSGTYSVNGNIFTTNQEELDFDGDFEMSPMEISEATISELTDERLVLTFDNIQVVNMEGMEVEIRIEGSQILTR